MSAATTVLIAILIALVAFLGICLIIVWVHFKKKQKQGLAGANESSSLLPDLDEVDQTKQQVKDIARGNMEKMKEHKIELRKKAAAEIEAAKQKSEKLKEKLNLQKELPKKPPNPFAEWVPPKETKEERCESEGSGKHRRHESAFVTLLDSANNSSHTSMADSGGRPKTPEEKVAAEEN